ncbi:ADP-ribosyltransferase [Aeromonas veronii]|uniref:ADP-ribosyltransferase n=1 Tax=Aeromonas veronii TaxID=654 RepID=UPI003A4DAC85
MQIQANTVGTQAVAHHSDATTGVGRMGQLEARQVATGQDAILLGNRSEPQKGQGLLSRLGAQLARPFVAIKEWIGNLLGSGKSAVAPKTQVAENLSMADQKRLFLQKALPYTLSALDKTSELKSINAEQLRKDHTTLATGNGALRSLVTALSGIRDGSKIEATTHQAARLLELNLGGMALQQWGTTGRQASEWVSSATQEQLGEVAAGLNDLMHEVAQLRYAVESEVKGEPADKALAEGLQNQFGLEAEQYLGEQPHGLYSDAEVMALGLYTNGEYQQLNRSLRQEKQLDAGQALIDQGMSAAFEKSTPAEQLVKTFRGTHGGDAFSGVTEGQVGHDAAYFSTSRDPKVAASFGGSGTISTVFGRSGIDVSDISVEGDEQEILYNKATDMRVLLSAKDERGVTRRVLEEAQLGEQSGHSKGLLDVLDLARGSGGADKPQEVDIRLKMRGLDLA